MDEDFEVLVERPEPHLVEECNEDLWAEEEAYDRWFRSQ